MKPNDPGQSATTTNQINAEQSYLTLSAIFPSDDFLGPPRPGGGVGPMMAKIVTRVCVLFLRAVREWGVQKCGKRSFISDAKEAKPCGQQAAGLPVS
eukprot:scaffold4756_cov124-Skeletonema_dohrnii-CCMP3373.AAC.3